MAKRMDSFPLVEHQISDGEKLVEKLRNSEFPVLAALWLKTSEATQWYLYIVSPMVEKAGYVKAYKFVLRAIKEMAQPFWIDPFEIKLIEPTNPIAEEIIGIQKRFPKSGPTRYGGMRLGGVTIDGAYLYPLMPLVPGKQ